MTTVQRTKTDALLAVKKIGCFIPKLQLWVIMGLCRGEERDFWRNKLCELTDLIGGMPKTYEQDGKGDDAIVYLHYFSGGCDWWITEKDSGTEQHQAFGLADLGCGTELGYISIVGLCEQSSVELDLHWTPKRLGDVRVD